MALLVALETRGTFITSAASDVLKFPERSVGTSESGRVKNSVGMKTVPDILL